MSIEVKYDFLNPYTEQMEYKDEFYPFANFEEFRVQFDKARKRTNGFKAWNCEPVYKIV